MNEIVRATGLVKRFGKVTALDGLDLAVPEGTVLGLLGPNGAGKTTAVSILTTLLPPDEGTAIVAGADVCAEPNLARERIGLSGQYAAVDEALTGFENLDMIGRLYHLGRKTSRRRATELLERFALTEAGNRPVKTYSGGMRRRLDLAGALVAEPPVLFLDEPTTGLDPRSRIDLWALIRELVGRGSTLLLTTQYLEEADQLADDIVVIDHGRAIAHGTADQLKQQVGGEQIEVVTTTEHVDQVSKVVGPYACGDLQVDRNVGRVLAPTRGGPKALQEVLADLETVAVEVREVGLRRPTLDDVFLALTGHKAEANGDGENGDGTRDGTGGCADDDVDPAGGRPSPDATLPSPDATLPADAPEETR